MVRSTGNTGLARFAVFTAGATLALISLGGLVTSHGAGLAVPDWPTTYGDNMFFFPFNRWQGGVFYEHTHRLAASLVGFLTVALAVWLWLKEERRWLRMLGIVAVVSVVLQGVLGGLRVTQLNDALGIFHAVLAQFFLVLLCSIALFTSRWWHRQGGNFRIYDKLRLRYLFALVTGMIVLQLIIGATIRHAHAGLAIPDFPAAYGQLWPDTGPSALASYNQSRMELHAAHPITAWQIVWQMIHRVMAVVILLGGWCTVYLAHRAGAATRLLRRASLGWVALMLCQALLGAATIWTNKSPDITTAHVALGAASLAAGALLCIVAFRQLRSPARAVVKHAPVAMPRERRARVSA